MEFYSQLAANYDEMTSFEKRIIPLSKMWGTWFDRYPATHILDAGCGTGVHSFAVEKAGKTVTGIDANEAMLSAAEKHARSNKSNISFLKVNIADTDITLPVAYDAIICMGNTFAHFLNQNDQIRVLRNFSATLKTSGYILIELINYDKILKFKPGILADRTIGDTRFIRSYQYNEYTIDFTVKQIKSNKQNSVTTQLAPIQSTEMQNLLKVAGFTDIRFFGSMNQDEFVNDESTNLVVLAHKSK